MRDRMLKMPSLVCVLGVVCPTLSLGNVIVSLNNEASQSLHEATVNPGDVLPVDVNVDSPGPLFSASAYIAASTSGVFAVNSGSYHTPWIEWESGPGFGIPIGPIDPISAEPFLGVSFSFVGGQSRIATLEVLIAPSAPEGDYFLDLADVEYREHFVIPETHAGLAGPAFVVHVLPEPSVLLLGCAGMVVLVRKRYRP